MRFVAVFSVLGVGCVTLVGSKSDTGSGPSTTPPSSTTSTTVDVDTADEERWHSGAPPHSGGTLAHTGSAGTGLDLLVPPPAVAAESVVCYFLEPNGYSLRLYAVGMDTGSVVEHSRWGAVTSSFHTAGIAYDGEHLVTGGYNGNDFSWFDLDLATTTMTQGGSYGRGADAGVSWYDNGASAGFLTLDVFAGDMPVYATAPDVVAGGPVGATIPAMSGFTRFTTDGTTLYGAWHSTAEVLVYDVPTRTQTGTISLTNWDTWVWGMSVANGLLHLIDDGRGFPGQTAPRIGVFDLAGANVANVMLTGHARAHGLVCQVP